MCMCLLSEQEEYQPPPPGTPRTPTAPAVLTVAQKRQERKAFKREVEQHYAQRALRAVLGARLSFSQWDKIRAAMFNAEETETPSRKRKHGEVTFHTPIPNSEIHV